MLIESCEYIIAVDQPIISIQQNNDGIGFYTLLLTPLQCLVVIVDSSLIDTVPYHMEFLSYVGGATVDCFGDYLGTPVSAGIINQYVEIVVVVSVEMD